MTRITKSERSELINDVHNFGINFAAREIFVGGQETDEINHVLSSQFIINLRLLDLSTGTILVHFNTVGGHWEYGMAMYDAIKHCTNKVISISYSHARSMSSIVPQSAHTRIIMPNAFFMVHNGTLEVEGTEKSVNSLVDFNKKNTNVMLDIYVNRCKNGKIFQGWSIDRIKKFLRNQMDKYEEWYLTAEEALEYGFMDAILGTNGYENIQVIRNREG